MIFQDPLTYLNPTMPIGKQVMESILIHQRLSKKEALERTIKILELAQIPDPEKRLKQYPHEFSGGMRQRVLISIALASNPKILIADEPTTALDVTIQAQILLLLQSIHQKRGTAILFISHDLSLVAQLCERVIVMQRGRIVEEGRTADIFRAPKETYTKNLMAAIPVVNLDD